MISKSKRAFRTISEVADEMDVPQHVLRFWETKFSQIKPMKRGGNRRYYRPDAVLVLKAIQYALYTDGYAIKDVQKTLKDKGVNKFVNTWKKATGYVEPKEKPRPPLEISIPPVKPSRQSPKVAAKKKAAEPAAPPAKEAASDDDSIRVSKDLVRALVADLRALRQLIDRLPD